jgi:hypothetical protein
MVPWLPGTAGPRHPECDIAAGSAVKQMRGCRRKPFSRRLTLVLVADVA